MKAILSMQPRHLLEERRALLGIIPRMEMAMTRGANYLIRRFAPHGPIMGARDLSYCHKVCWGLFEAGRLDAVEQILDWIDAHAKQGVARYYFPEEPPFNKEMQLLYRFLTFGKVAEAIRHPAFCTEEIRQEVLTYQHPCGGVFANKDLPEYRRSLEPLNTSFFGIWALAAGLTEAARKAGDFLVRMVELNEPYLNSEPGRFYFNFDPHTEELITNPDPDGKVNCYVDTVGAKQHFYMIGTSMALLADLYAATHVESYLDAALRLADFEQRLNPEGLRWPSYCKIAWGAAELFAVTGDPAHRQAAANVCDVTFLQAQTASGGWEDMFYPVRDTGVWTKIVYDGRGLVPKSLQDDGSFGWLAGEEITGEFMGEMGRALHVFRQALGVIEQRLEQGMGENMCIKHATGNS